MSIKNIEILAEVKKGRQRRLVIQHMDYKKSLLVSEIQKRVNNYIRISKDGKEIRLSDVSRTLGRLVELGLIKCLNPRKRIGDKGILYQLTAKGNNIRKLL
jgi:Fe2+ or Zn2+ uptake regulation protein